MCVRVFLYAYEKIWFNWFMLFGSLMKSNDRSWRAREADGLILSPNAEARRVQMGVSSTNLCSQSLENLEFKGRGGRAPYFQEGGVHLSSAFAWCFPIWTLISPLLIWIYSLLENFEDKPRNNVLPFNRHKNVTVRI